MPSAYGDYALWSSPRSHVETWPTHLGRLSGEAWGSPLSFTALRRTRAPFPTSRDIRARAYGTAFRSSWTRSSLSTTSSGARSALTAFSAFPTAQHVPQVILFVGCGGRRRGWRRRQHIQLRLTLLTPSIISIVGPAAGVVLVAPDLSRNTVTCGAVRVLPQGVRTGGVAYAPVCATLLSCCAGGLGSSQPLGELEWWYLRIFLFAVRALRTAVLLLRVAAVGLRRVSAKHQKFTRFMPLS